MQNQWEPWACFPATRWSHLGVMGDSDTQNVLLMSSLLCNLVLVAVAAENLASQRQGVGKGSRLFSAFVATSGYSALTLIQNAWGCEVVSNTLSRPPPFVISSSWSSFSMELIHWASHKWVADPFLPNLGVFCGWAVMLKPFWKLR